MHMRMYKTNGNQKQKPTHKGKQRTSGGCPIPAESKACRARDLANSGNGGRENRASDAEVGRSRAAGGGGGGGGEGDGGTTESLNRNGCYD